MISHRTRNKEREWNDMLNWVAEIEGDGGVVHSVTFPCHYPVDLVKCFEHQTRIKANRHSSTHYLSMNYELGVFDGEISG